MLAYYNNGANISPIGSCNIEFEYGNKVRVISILVIRSGGPPLLGKKFLKIFKICS